MHHYRRQSREEYRHNIVGLRHGKWYSILPFLVAIIFLINMCEYNFYSIFELFVVASGMSIIFYLMYWFGERQIRKSIHRKRIRSRRVFPNFAFSRPRADSSPIPGITALADPILGPIRSIPFDFENGTSSASGEPSSSTFDSSDSSWYCPKCKEEIESQFFSCWQCGTQKPSNA